MDRTGLLQRCSIADVKREHPHHLPHKGPCGRHRVFIPAVVVVVVVLVVVVTEAINGAPVYPGKVNT